MRAGSFWTLMLSLLAPYFWPAHGAACECLASAIYRSDPPDGAHDVPLNQALVIEGDFVLSSLRLEDANGAAIGFELNQGPAAGSDFCPSIWAELVLKEPLEPNSDYVIHVDPAQVRWHDPAERLRVVFRTGERRLVDGSLAMPSARASVVTGVMDSSLSCGGPGSYLCLGVPDSEGIEIIARHGDEVDLRWLLPKIDDGGPLEGPFVLRRAPDCLEFRRRSRTGRRSRPLVLCGDALPARAMREGDISQGFLTCHNGVVGEPEPMRGVAMAGASAAEAFARLSQPQVRGCSAIHPRSASAAGWIVLLMLGAHRLGTRIRRRYS